MGNAQCGAECKPCCALADADEAQLRAAAPAPQPQPASPGRRELVLSVACTPEPQALDAQVLEEEPQANVGKLALEDEGRVQLSPGELPSARPGEAEPALLQQRPGEAGSLRLEQGGPALVA